MNIKLKKYKDYPFKIFFVVTGIECSQGLIDSLIANKINKLFKTRYPLNLFYQHSTISSFVEQALSTTDKKEEEYINLSQEAMLPDDIGASTHFIPEQGPISNIFLTGEIDDET